MRCHACGRVAAPAPGGRIGIREVCEGCGADLHACRNCAHYDPSAYNECGETQAERVLDKDRANRCDWFAPAPDTGKDPGGSRDESAAARAELEALFKK